MSESLNLHLQDMGHRIKSARTLQTLETDERRVNRKEQQKTNTEQIDRTGGRGR